MTILMNFMEKNFKSRISKIMQPLNFKLSRHSYQYLETEIASLRSAYKVILSNTIFESQVESSIRAIAWNNKKASRNEKIKLAKILKAEGSDKSTRHSYSDTYSDILVNLNATPTIVEVGIGSAVPANVGFMGPGYRAGASLRAWKKFLPDSHVIGADIDESTLAPQEGLVLRHIDQSDSQSLRNFADFLGLQTCDLIVDDGLHSPLAAVNTFTALWPCVKTGGFFVIEDMSSPLKSFYRDLAYLFYDVTYEFREMSDQRSRITNCLSIYRKI